MQNKLLVDLLHDLEQEMLRLGYTEGYMQFYRRRWKKFLQFAEEQQESVHSEQLGMDFLEKHFHIFEKDCNKTLSQSETQELRIVRMIGNFHLHQTVLRRYYKHKDIITDPYFVSLSNRFKTHCVSKNYSKVTTDHYVKQSERFMDYLVSQNVKNCQEINLILIHAYLKNFGWIHL